MSSSIGPLKKSDVNKNAFLLFLNASRSLHLKHRPNSSISVADFSQYCANRWRALSEEDKNAFRDVGVGISAATRVMEAEEARTKPHNIWLRVTGPEETPQKSPKVKKGKRAKKDPMAPKKPMSSFFLFCNEARQGVRDANPGLAIGGVAKILGALWKDLKPAEKGKYEAIAQQEGKRYHLEKQNYLNKLSAESFAQAEGHQFLPGAPPLPLKESAMPPNILFRRPK